MTKNLQIANGKVQFLLELAALVRADVYSTFNVAAGKGYSHQKRRLSSEVIRTHASNEQPIAVFLVHGNTTRLAALDVDNHGGELSWEQVVKRVLPLFEGLKSRGLKPLPFRSGGGAGIHLWLAWSELQSARNVRRFLAQVLAEHGFENGTKGLAERTIEIYPKQDKVDDLKVGNPIALPLARKSVPLDDSLIPIDDAGYTLLSLKDCYSPPIAKFDDDELKARHPVNDFVAVDSPYPNVVLEGDLDEVKSALRHVQSDDRDTWIRVGLALKHGFGDLAFETWDDWSRSSSKYTGGVECRETWDGLTPDGTIGIGSLFYKAQRGGWNGPSNAEIREMNGRYGIYTHANKTMIILKKQQANHREVFTWLKKEPFLDREAADSIPLPTPGGGMRNVNKAKFWLAHKKASHYHRIDFDPALPPGDNGKMWNIWTGFAVQARRGDWSLLQSHIRDNICAGDEELFHWLMNWMALGVQKPGEVIGTAPVMRGLPGIGKGVLAHAYGSLWGRHYAAITHESHVSGRFNAHMFGKRFVFIDEGTFGGNRKEAGVIKTRITEPYIMLEAKGVDSIEIPNRMIFMIASNEDSVVPADMADRRWQVLDVSDRYREDRVYFGAIVGQLNSGGRMAMLHDLLARNIGEGPDPRRTIKTQGLFNQIILAQGPELKYIYQLLDEGVLPQPDAPGNGPGITTIQAMYEDLKHSQPNPQYVQKSLFGRKLKDMFPRLTTVQSGIYLHRHGVNIERVRTTRYSFPNLLSCRKSFELHIGQPVPWSNDLQDWQLGLDEVVNREPF